MSDPSSDKLDSVDELLDSLQGNDPMGQKGQIPEPDLADPDVKKVIAEPLTVHKSLDAPEPAKVDPIVDKLAVTLLAEVKTLVALNMNRLAEDRCEVQEVIDHYKKKLFDGSQMTAAEHECLCNALKVKTDATASMSKLGDMIARVLSSGKSHLGGQTASAFDVDDLHQRLETPDYGDAPTNIDEKPQRKDASDATE